MTLLYVDECGEEGFSETSSRWLIVGGVLQRDPEILQRMISTYDAFKAEHCPDNWRGLQMADCVVSSIGAAWEASRFGLYEPRYLRDLRPLFHFDSLTYGRAIKIWPSVPADLITGELK
jgi:hypothetical protein